MVKNKPKPEAMAAALKDIESGLTAYAAAKKHGVAQSSLSRALYRLANSCPCCGQYDDKIKKGELK